MLRHPAGVAERLAQKHLDLGVEAAELIRGPPGERIMDRRVET
jgi:hypothetical protein